MTDFNHIIDRHQTDSLKWDAMPVSATVTDQKLLPMWVSDYDFPVAPAVQAALQKRLEHGVFGYSVRSESYFCALQNWFSRRHQLNIDKQWICSVEGMVPGLALLIQMLSQPQEGVVIQGPYYGSFARIIQLNQRILLENPLIADKDLGYRMDLAHLENLFRTKQPPLMILCNPHNPCGRCWSPAELEQLITLCRQYNVMLLSDEIWCDLLLPGAHFSSLLHLCDAQQDNVIVANSASKTFGLSGLRITNFIIPQQQLREQFIQRLDAHGMDVFNVLSMTAATAAYHQAENWLDQLLAYLAQNRQWFCQQAAEYLPWANIIPAQASYLLWIDCQKLQLDDIALKQTMTEQAGIVPSMGSGFGPQGRGFIRLNLGCPRAYLQQAIEGLRRISYVP